MERKKRSEDVILFPDSVNHIFVSCKEYPSILPLAKELLSIFLNVQTFAHLSSFHITYTTDKEIAVLNNTYKKKQTATDVLSFPYQEDTYMGDIVISLETVASQANEFSCSFLNEFCRVTIHGILHLLGFIDTIPIEKKKMWDDQERLVSLCLKQLPSKFKGITLP
jgi:probable rRNA maturation factor